MISISKLWCDEDFPHNNLRYGESRDTDNPWGNIPSAKERKPIIVWNCTKSCNLKCVHCYSDSTAHHYENELTTAEGKNLLTQLRDFGVKAVLFSGGEPLMRSDIFELLGYASDLGLRTVLSTNGTLIDHKLAAQLRALNPSYIGISLDGIGTINDDFRGVSGAFARASDAFDNCIKEGIKTGLRLTMTKHTIAGLENIFKFIEEKNIPRVCFYHLVPAGRGQSKHLLSAQESRMALDLIIEKAEQYAKQGIKKDILTVDNHVDGVYLYLKMMKKDKKKATEIKKHLLWNGGGRYSTGIGIGEIDFYGNVHPDQFWMHYTFGNIRERSFADIWTDERDDLLRGLRNRLPLLKGKCSRCAYVEMCGGSLRVRAEIIHGDQWQEDPACYLSEEEIAQHE
ncbi:MAG: hypothetical protein DKM50_02355 [Candidatus Margulisiibacteriota bacterium]|nr:MAG: hypothetical protein A2X43_06810 [Candidatus Margulisbacteria bacterium GWD2_39_127]OGI05271.1 MAG: hypothetical protein A2X42_03675 [Candidatus Margulisbacteria bacterium GWF2_38_17]OGI10870.1 MAG: hypothetical protein A2X41_05800 [Candidatus Margulisbacteria bacterium GWE2_39_32]PZM83558.1 MAG: hypothetical protein DKM50_02355 [Candidatus Margulisiibacteriota bacterium]HAR64264.1 hypothetical protein [Candidatus Margulisiibacteriota bacterium]